jgi:hypothetical protein
MQKILTWKHIIWEHPGGARVRLMCAKRAKPARKSSLVNDHRRPTGRPSDCPAVFNPLAHGWHKFHAGCRPAGQSTSSLANSEPQMGKSIKCFALPFFTAAPHMPWHLENCQHMYVMESGQSDAKNHSKPTIMSNCNICLFCLIWANKTTN